MTIQRRQAIKTGAALSAALAAPWVHAQKADKVKLSWLPIMQTTALYVAVQDRLFERAGIEAELVQFQNPNQIIDSLVANQADAGAPGAAAGITMLAESRYPGTFKVFGLQGGGDGSPDRVAWHVSPKLHVRRGRKGRITCLVV